MENNSKLLVKISILYVILSLCFTLGCQQPVTEGLTAQEANAILDKILAVYNEGNLELVDEIVAPENKLHNSAYPEDIVGIE